MKRMLLLLLLVPVAFAAWQNVTLMAVTASAALLAIIYMVGTGFSINELQIMAKEEFWQLLVLGLLMVALVSTDNILNGISTSPAFTDQASTMQEAARIILNETLVNTTAALNNIAAYDLAATKEASKASSCSVLGTGYSVSACGGYTMLSTPLSMAGGITGFAIGELSAMMRLIEISERYALTLLLPIGILLRTLKVTRGAGGLLIALGVSLHIMLPAGIIFNEMLAVTFLANTTASAEYQPDTTLVNLKECNPGKTGVGFMDLEGALRDWLTLGGVLDEYLFGLYDAFLDEMGLEEEDMSPNDSGAIMGYTTLRQNIRAYLFQVLIRATMGPVIALLLMAASIRTLTSIAGSEVDVTAISRFV